MKQYSGEAVHKVVDMFMEIICEQDEEIRALQAKRPTVHFDNLKGRVERLVELANLDDYVSSEQIFTIFGGRHVH